MMKKLSLIVWLVVLAAIVSGQAKGDDKTTTAVKRAQQATNILRTVAALPEGKGIPKEISDKMNLIGVIPDASTRKFLFASGLGGRGVSSLRQDNVWSLPSYYVYGQSQAYELSVIGDKNFDLIMVVVNARLPHQKKPKNKSDEPHVYAYALVEGELRALPPKNGFMASTFGGWTNLEYDKSLNKAVYNAKGDDILLGKTDPTKIPPAEVVAFRDALQDLFGPK